MSELLTDNELRGLLADTNTRRRGFALLVKLYHKQIYWQIRRIVYNHEDANDLVQNTFLKVWDSLDSFRGEAKLSTWIYRIALYEALGWVRKQQREVESIVDIADPELAESMLQKLTADEYFDGDDYEIRFQKALLSLPEKQQLVFRLRYYDEMPYDQIAELTGTSVGALKASYHHAANKVRQSLIAED